MSTGTVQNPTAQVITDFRHDALQHTFVNDNGADLTPGQEVYLKSNGTIARRALGTEPLLGIVIVGSIVGQRATVRTFFTQVLNGVAKGGTINAGTLVVQDGTKNADGQPNYVVAEAGDYTAALVIKGGAANAVIKVGVIDGVSHIGGAVITPQSDATLAAQAAYTDVPAALGDAATLADLNDLRADHEALKALLVSSGLLT